VPEVGNLGLSYIRNPITVRLQFNHTGRYLSSYNASPARLLYRRERNTLNIKSVYNINRKFDLYMDVYNVFNDPNRLFEWYGGRPDNIRKGHVMFLAGVNGRL
jgi:hypothetical protein